MNNYLSFDIGTTGCKCQLFDENGNILEYIYKEYNFKFIDNEKYVNIAAITENVLEMLRQITKKHIVYSICFSTIGESFVLLDKDDNILFYPMIYTDKRGYKEAQYLTNTFTNKTIFERCGVIPHAMFSISKLLYIKNNYPNIYQKADKLLLMCDYLGYYFTGKRYIDYSLAARTGIFNINDLEFDKQLCDKLEIDTSLFSIPKNPGFNVGIIKEKFKKMIGIDYDIKLVLGAHDQICNAIGCNCLSPGDATDGIGTVECITTIFDKKSNDINMTNQGYTISPFLHKGLYCTFIINYACNSITNWFKNEINHNYYPNFFDYMEQNMDDEIDDLYVLPYFEGCAIPYQDINAKGAFIGLTTSTKDYQLYKCILESLAMEMRFETENATKYGIEIKNVVATGGGAKSKKRLQMKANIQNVNVHTLRSDEGGLCGCAILQAYGACQFKTLKEAANKFSLIKDSYYPNNEKYIQYQEKYNKYKKIYKQLKEIF